jgi:hypothetical protein
MCFSASASFSTGAVLGTIGVITLTKVKEFRQAPFAVIPILFGIQQFSEGMLWIGLSDPTHASWRHFAVYIFLIFAQLVWPAWVPFSVFLLEKEKVRRRILTGLMVMGLSISLYLLYCMLTYDVSAEIQSGHIHYTLSFPMAFTWVTSVMYFVPTVMTLFISSVKKMPLLGVAILLSFMLTKIFFEDYLISVWCFFAAVLSLVVLWIASQFNKKTLQKVL